MQLPQTPLLTEAMQLVTGAVPRPEDLRRAVLLILDYLDRLRREAERNDEGNSDALARAVPTGTILFGFWLTAPEGYLPLDGSTIGNASSGADFADSTYQALYTHLWTNVADTYAPVTGGRGASATADWNAGKPLTLPNAKGRSPIGAGQGHTAEGNGVGTDHPLGSTGGAETHTLTAAQLATHFHVVPFSANQATVYGNSVTAGAGEGGEITANATEGGEAFMDTSDAGDGEPHNNLHPYLAVNWFIKV